MIATVKDFPSSLSTRDIFGISAFTLVHAFAMLVASSSLFAEPLLNAGMAGGMEQVPGIVYMLFLGATLFALGYDSRLKAWMGYGPALTLAPLVLGLFSCCVSVVAAMRPVFAGLILLAWAAFGIANGIVLLRVGLYYSTIGKRKAFSSSAIALLISGLLYLVVENTGVSFGIVCTFLFLCASIVMLVFTPQPAAGSQAKGIVKIRHFPAELAGSYLSEKRSATFFIIMFFYCLVFGFSTGEPPSSLNSFGVNLNGVAPAIGGVLAVVYVSRTKGEADLFVAQWGLLAILVVGTALPLVNDSSPIRLASILLLWVGFSAYDISNWCSLYEACQERNSVFVFGVGRSLFTFGLLVGRLLFYVVANFLSNSGSVALTSIVLILCVFFLCLILSNMHLIAAESSCDSSVERTEDVVLEPLDDEPGEVSEGEKAGAAIKALAEDNGLTRREQEVFELLAKGRNVAYIQTSLVLSRHTVRSHVYHIYQKLDVHSHQELIDVVEAEAKDADEARSHSDLH